MQSSTIQQFNEIIKVLPDDKKKAVLDFACYLRDRGISEALFEMQKTSTAYQEWLSDENDVYDKVFQNELQ